MKLISIAEMHRVEEECNRLGISNHHLMENAGGVLADRMADLLSPIEGRQILVMVGPGGNGGDALVAARRLYEKGAQIIVFLPCKRSANIPQGSEIERQAITCITDAGELRAVYHQVDGVIDGLLGTGALRPITGAIGEGLAALRELKANRPEVVIVAVDVPSGLNADSGEVDPLCPEVDYTLCLGAAKPGLFSAPGIERVGRVEIVDIGIPEELFPASSPEVISPRWARLALPQRPPVSHKGSFGRVLIIAGSLNYTGAAYLASSAAMRTGAGLVTLAAPANLLAILASKLTEAIHLPLPHEGGYISPSAVDELGHNLEEADSVLLGCGLGQGEPVVGFIEALLPHLSAKQVAVDADGLNILSRIPQWWERLQCPAVLTPHPGELARMTNLTTREVQEKRLQLLPQLVHDWQKVVVLKGAYSIVAAPGKLRLNLTATPALASAGTGDVLAGIIAGLLAQGLSPFDAACLGVFLHGKAGERAEEVIGDAGALAGDLLPLIPQIIRHLKEGGS